MTEKFSENPTSSFYTYYCQPRTAFGRIQQFSYA